MKRANRLKGVSPLDFIDIAFNKAEQRYLEKLARSLLFKDRVLCLDYINDGRSVRRNHSFILPLLDKLVMDNRVRYQALGIIADFVEECPEKIWPYVLKYSSSPNRYLREAVAASVLEVLLSAHHTKYFPEIKRRVLGGDRKLLDTLTGTWPFGVMPVRYWHQRVRLIKKAGGDLDRVYVGGKYQFPSGIQSK